MQIISDAPVADWSRHRVQELTEPVWTELSTGARAWLWLDGAHSDTLENEVTAVTHRFNHRWIWRGTEREYQNPGYRQGPMLVPLDAPLLDHFLATWAPQSAGLILLSQAGDDVLVGHLQQLHQFIAADGLPLRFSLAALRQLEELCDGLPSQRLAELFGPIDAMIWRAGDRQPADWLRADTPHNGGLPLASGQCITLSADDEAELDRASFAWFLRDTTRRLTQQYPALVAALDRNEFAQQLTAFASEANNLGLHLERDARHYMALRLTYPQEPFERDTVLRTRLGQRHIAGQQRLFDLEDHLRRLAPSVT
ncbi:hypothetical protein [Caballeronia sp. LjRoot31]|jgi:hypothetical protein|uniref:hypothetical protein n=1 Tax=Caballeronia sp. LjRoot31 TaxID=3342324 RepID=UPI003ECD4114